jgi:Phage portal protein, SPP1 Gp6-like
LFETICELIPWDRDFPDRTRRLDLLRRVLDGTFYDVLPYEFHQERTAGDEYIPLRKRRPSVRYGLPRIVVEDSVALLFSEGHFPTLDSTDREVRAAVSRLVKASRLNAVMTEAALRGSVGSVAVLMRVLCGRVFLDVLESLYLTPEWEPDAPDTLCCVTERYKVSGAALAAQGYRIQDPGATYWFTRQWNAECETWFEPVEVGCTTEAAIDRDRSVRHGLGFVPLTWIKNLPGGSGADGACTFRASIETSVEIDYQLSQAGRGLKYSDPTLLIREPAGLDTTMVRGAANALVLSEKGDAKLLEIGGTASQAVIEYVRTLRELALESVHGNRVDASRLTTPASGRALELMNQGLLWLADNLRVSYGEQGLLAVVRMMLRAAAIYKLEVDGKALPPLPEFAPLGLRWPAWYSPDSLDRQRDAETVTTLVDAGQMSRETGLQVLAPSYDIEDVPAELARINAERTA